MLAFALRADGWYLRQDIIWAKTNVMPEPVKDRCTKSHEYVFLLSKSARYYFNADKIREPCTSAPKGHKDEEVYKFRIQRGGWKHDPEKAVPENGRNKRDVWTISTGRFKGAHFAVFPEKLVEPCILAGCPEGGTVLDPFMGSGTTGVVARRLWRDFVGVELNPEYHRMAMERICATPPEAWQLAINEG